MTMRIIMRRGGEESFLVPIDNFEKCQSLCTYWNKVSSLESNHIMKVTISIHPQKKPDIYAHENFFLGTISVV